jgi:hypothetical protein
VSSPSHIGVRLVDDPLDLLVDERMHVGRGLARAGEQRALGGAREQRDGAESLAHAPPPHHLARDLRQMLEVRLRAGGDRAVHELLGGPATERDPDLGLEVLARVRDAVAVGRRQRHPERHPARDDRHLAHGVGVGGQHPHERVAGLVVRGALAVARAQQDPAGRAEQHLLERVGQVRHAHAVVAAARGQQRGLVGEVREIGADHPRRRGGEGAEVDIAAQRNRSRVDLEDLAPPVAVGRLHRHAPVEAARAQQRRVQDLGPVGRAEHDDRVAGLEAVHLGEDLVERLLALVVRAHHAGRALARAADRVELVDEDDRRRGLLGLREQVAHARRAHADDRLDELRRRDREERRVRLPRDRPGEQRLARAGNAEQQHAVRHPAAQPPVLLRRAQEVDDLAQLGLRVVDPGDVVERRADPLRIGPPRPRAAERAQTAEAAPGRRPPAEQDEQADEQKRRAEAEQQLDPKGRAGAPGVDLDALGLQEARQLGVTPERRHLRGEVRGRCRLRVARRIAHRARERALDRVARGGDRLDVAGLHL